MMNEIISDFFQNSRETFGVYFMYLGIAITPFQVMLDRPLFL